MNEFMKAMEFRHACKRFDTAKRIPEDELAQLMEIVRLSPSSFGMEPWRLIVVRSPELKAKLRPLCWNQPQVTECSELVIFTTDNESVKGGTEYVKAMFSRRGLDAEMTAKYQEVYANYLASLEADERLLENWTAKQCYIAAANLMTGAASLQIDSCPIEGFEKEKVEACLELEVGEHAALIVALGYRTQPQSERARLELSEIVRYM